MSVPREQWTAEERELDRISWALSSKNQMVRIEARIDCANFEKLHGKEAVDAMWERIK